MIDTIVVDYNPFAMESRVSIFRDGERGQSHVYSSIEELTNGIIDLAYGQNIYNVKINGPFDIANEVGRMVREYESTQFSINRINVGNL